MRQDQRDTSEPRRALYIGRFQIMHNGHVGVVKHIESHPDIDEIVIGIGSSQYSRDNPSPEAPLVINPFTYDERAAFVGGALGRELHKPFSIVGIQDQHDCARWARYVFTVSPRISAIYTNSRREREAFAKLGYECRGFPVPDKFHAQIIREMIAHDDPWERMVPAGAAEVIKARGLDTMLRDLYTTRAADLEGVHALQRRNGILTYDEAIGRIRSGGAPHGGA